MTLLAALVLVPGLAWIMYYLRRIALALAAAAGWLLDTIRMG